MTKCAKKPDWRKTGVIAGIKVRQIPIVGNGASMPSGSDSYGYLITEVSDDGTEFKYDARSITYDDEKKQYVPCWVHAGTARLITRKNSRARGCYGEVDEQTGKIRARFCTRSWFGLIYPLDTKGAPEDYRDPSF